MQRVRPVWIPTRVPALIACESCLTSEARLEVVDESKSVYRYVCRKCGTVSELSLEQLNDPVWRARAACNKAS